MILVLILTIMLLSTILLMNVMSLLDNDELYIVMCYDMKCNKSYLKVSKNYKYIIKVLHFCLHNNIEFTTYHYKNRKLKELDLI